MEPATERVQLLCNHDVLPQLQSRFPLVKQRLYNSEPQTVTGVGFSVVRCHYFQGRSALLGVAVKKLVVGSVSVFIHVHHQVSVQVVCVHGI